jgi:hypothetical protein
MNRHKSAVVTALLLLCFASASSATRKFTCNSGGRVFTLVSDVSPANVTLMWAKSGADNDIVVFLEDSDEVVASGLGIVDRFERVTFGTLPGIGFDIVVAKSGGPNSKCYLNIGAELQALRASSGHRLRERGSLVELAKRDDRYARILETVERYRAIKAPVR